MQGARRRPYVDMVKEGNPADDRPGRNPGGDGAPGDDVPPSPVAKRRMDDEQATSARAGAHLFVGSPCNIDILLRALLLDLHPTSPPSHTCLVMKQVLTR